MASFVSFKYLADVQAFLSDLQNGLTPDPVMLEKLQAETADYLANDENDFPEDNDDPFYGDDAAADADVLRSAGMGTDEDYGYFGGDDY